MHYSVSYLDDKKGFSDLKDFKKCTFTVLHLHNAHLIKIICFDVNNTGRKICKQNRFKHTLISFWLTIKTNVGIECPDIVKVSMIKMSSYSINLQSNKYSLFGLHIFTL